MENAIRSDATVEEINEARRELQQVIQLLCDNFEKKFVVFPDVSTKIIETETKNGTLRINKIEIRIYF